MKDEKARFKAFCSEKPEIPLFLSHEWLSTVAEDHEWGVHFSGSSEDPSGFIVYFIKRRFGFKRITIPPLTPYLGPWIFYPEGQKQAQRLAHEKKVLEELIAGLPRFDDLTLKLHPKISNVLPFYWEGFKTRLCYTYIIQDTQDTEKCFNQLRGNIRGAIRKAIKKYTVEYADEVESIHELKLKDYRVKKKTLSYSLEYFQKIDQTLAANGKRKILHAVDANGTVRGGVYLVWDNEQCYYLIGAADPEVKNEGVLALLIWEGLVYASELGLPYNFEGSMIEPIERFFRSFGAEQLPYPLVNKTPSWTLRGLKAYRVLRGKDL